MQLTVTFLFSAVVALAANLPAALAADCLGQPGAANAECVKYYSNAECKGDAISSYRPTCKGNCYQAPFSSVKVAGDGTYGTDCVLYSDENCTVEQTVSSGRSCLLLPVLCHALLGRLMVMDDQDSGNVVTGPGKCVAAPNAKSMKCFYRC